jgi:hypothetical protein
MCRVWWRPSHHWSDGAEGRVLEVERGALGSAKPHCPGNEGLVASQTSATHVEITETLLRLYVFLAQYLDRCLDESLRKSFPEAELQEHLHSTRQRIMEILSVNRVVRGKVEQECERILSLGVACLKTAGAPAGAQVTTDTLKAERALLKTKTTALSDLLAVFRAL